MVRESGVVKKSVVEDGSTVYFMGRLRKEGNHENKKHNHSKGPKEQRSQKFASSSRE